MSAQLSCGDTWWILFNYLQRWSEMRMSYFVKAWSQRGVCPHMCDQSSFISRNMIPAPVALEAKVLMRSCWQACQLVNISSVCIALKLVVQISEYRQHQVCNKRFIRKILSKWKFCQPIECSWVIICGRRSTPLKIYLLRNMSTQKVYSKYFKRGNTLVCIICRIAFMVV